MGIFELVCPSCGEVNSVDAGACRCGHIFAAVTGSYEAAQLTLQEEEAYLEYIEARLGQLNYDKKFAKSDIEAHPGVPEKEQRLEEIRQEIAELKAQREAQLVKIRATRKVNDEFKKQLKKEQAEASAKAEAEALRLKKEKEKTEALMRAKKEQERKREAQAAAEKKAREEAAQQKKVQEEARRKAALEKHAREAEEKQRKLEAARIAKGAEARRKQEAQQRVLAEAERVKKQAAEAMAKAELVKKRAAVTKNNSAPQPGSSAGAGQASSNVHEKPSVSASEVVDDIPQATTQECPICTAELPLDARQCACGYSFETSASDMPSLSSGDFFAPPEPESGAETQECPVCTAELPLDAKSCNCGYQFPTGESTMPGLSLDGGLKD
jgi:DNA repair exonuclease SbcCD ATPase subunit